MKKVLLFSFVFILFAVSLTPSISASTFSKTYNSCDGYNHVVNHDGGRLAYGCNTWWVDEIYSTFSKDTSNSYRGMARSSDGTWNYGPYKKNNAQSEAERPFKKGTQKFGAEL